MIYFFAWWLIIEILGWLALPLAMRVLHFLPDRGFTFSKALGLLVASYLLWIGASTRLLSNDLGGILFAILLLAGISAWCLRKKRAAPEIQEQPAISVRDFVRENRRLVLSVELLFFLAFAAWAILRAFAPEKIMSAGGEKYMEIAFLNAILNSRQFPPLDPWLSGFSISYYYFGYVMMALVTRISGAPSGIGFDLYDALLFSLSILGTFGVVYNLVAAARLHLKSPGEAQSQPIRYGLLGAFFLAIMGNLEGLFEALYSRNVLPESFWKWINIPDLLGILPNGTWNPGASGGWWWWRASRVIQDLNLDYQNAPYSPISEFPFFSFLLGDNHPHVLGLPFVLLAAALALNLLLGMLRRTSPVAEAGPAEKPEPWGYLSAYARLVYADLGGDWLVFLVFALVLGGLGFLNTWDLPIYLGLALLAYGAGIYYHRRKLDAHLVWRVGLLGVGLLAGSIFLYIFFYLSFSSQASGILPYIFPPTRLPQYLMMFGPLALIALIFLGTYLTLRFNSANDPSDPDRLTSRLRSALAAWLWVILACVGLLLVLLGAAALAVKQQMASGTLEPVLQTALGGRSLSETFRASLSARLHDPWLFLVLSALIGLAVAGFLRANRSGAPAPAAAQKPGSSPRRFEPSPSDLFVLLLVFTGLALTFSTEFFYLRDSFGYRMNTIFKFYYQAWVMLSCACAYALWWLVNPARPAQAALFRYTWPAIVALAIAGSMAYPLMAFNSRVNGFKSQPNLDGASGFALSNPDDWAAIQWLQHRLAASQDQLPGSSSVPGASVPVILEAPGLSYTFEGRISAFSGAPALLGWAVHESQWRGNYEEQGKREPDIITIYTSSDAGLTLELLHKWNVGYVILGQPEMNYIQRQCQDAARRCNLTTALRKFEQALKPVFTQGMTTIYQVP